MENSKILAHSQIIYLEDYNCEMSYASYITGHGFAKKIVHETIKYCLKNNFTKIQLYIAAINIASVKVAEKNGFVVTEEFEVRQNLILNEDIIYRKWILER